jgi:hypothetical protein
MNRRGGTKKGHRLPILPQGRSPIIDGDRLGGINTDVKRLETRETSARVHFPTAHAGRVFSRYTLYLWKVETSSHGQFDNGPEKAGLADHWDFFSA